MCANNRICKIEPSLAEYLPNLTTLVLANNQVEELGDLDPLGNLEWLQDLVLHGNPVTRKEYYRLYILHRCPKLRMLDYRKIKEKVRRMVIVSRQERKQALELFQGEKGTALAHTLSSQAGNVFDPDADAEAIAAQKKRHLLSKEDQAHLVEAIKNAKSLAEIASLEQQLAGGIIPGR
ncbi:U2 small nuclear ribonucleoprotein A' [Kappamyces sp. JEL0680]|nr:U2 small nuclear ribonucleoprotein A' [Kappamyces sp. JEL0680]